MTDATQTYIVLLRGVMPSGKNSVPMAQLRDVLGADGFADVRTYIQSGNALLRTALPPADLEARVHDLIRDHIGPDLTVVARTAQQLQAMLDGNPFADLDISRVFFASFAQTPPDDRIAALHAEDFTPEQVRITPHAGYLYIPGSAARSKLSNNFLEKRLGVAATARNFNTISKLVELAQTAPFAG